MTPYRFINNCFMAFILILIIIYTQIILVYYSVKFILTKKDQNKNFSEHLIWLFKVKLLQDEDAQPLDKKNKIIYLCNHRSFADFFIDSYICNQAAQLARYAVALVMPISALYGLLTARVIFFYRKRKLGLSSILIKKINNNWQRRNTGLVVYPEGHRNLNNASLPLKTGVLRIAYNNNIPVQIIITTNKDKVIAEKSLKFKLNVQCIIKRSLTLYPESYNDVSAWIAAINHEWYTLWDKPVNKTVPFL